ARLHGRRRRRLRWLGARLRRLGGVTPRLGGVTPRLGGVTPRLGARLRGRHAGLADRQRRHQQRGPQEPPQPHHWSPPWPARSAASFCSSASRLARTSCTTSAKSTSSVRLSRAWSRVRRRRVRSALSLIDQATSTTPTSERIRISYSFFETDWNAIPSTSPPSTCDSPS